MRIRFHRFLLMLLMLALPLQAWAAVSMLGWAVQDRAAMDAMERGAMVDPVASDCHEPGPPDTPSTQHNCRHCAACALATLPPIPLAGGAAILPAARHYPPQPAVSFKGFVPNGPERPPRLTLA